MRERPSDRIANGIRDLAAVPAQLKLNPALLDIELLLERRIGDVAEPRIALHAYAVDRESTTDAKWKDMLPA